MKKVLYKEAKCIWGKINTRMQRQIAKGNSFLRDILAGWCKINYLGGTQAVAKEILWNNSQITCGDKLLFYRE